MAGESTPWAFSITMSGMVRSLRKLAIVLQCASTGGWRYCLRLAEGLSRQRPELELTCYLGSQVTTTFAGDEPLARLAEAGVVSQAWPELPERPAKKRRWWRTFKYHQAHRHFDKWLQHFDQYDLVFFAWPYLLECPETSARVAFIPHDFNYLHFMGTFNMAPADAERQYAQHARWLQRGTPIVSTNFIADELQRAFPQCRQRPRVVPLARLSDQNRLPSDQARQIVQRLGIDGDYMLSVNNISHHKNLGQVLSAFHYVQANYPDMRMVIVGHNTLGVQGYVPTPWYVDQNAVGGHVLSLGMRSDLEVAALIQCARLVINASLYEAGNGSGLDSWALGTPVVMSEIPAFCEHISTLGVRAELFHPRCCFQIRDAILTTLRETERIAEQVAISQAAMQKYNWDDVARQYLDAFDQLLESEPHSDHGH